LIEFSGGPNDGLTLEVGFVPSRTLFASATPWSSARVATESKDRHAAKYEFVGTHILRDADGLPLVHTRYRFDGVEHKPSGGIERFVWRLSEMAVRPSKRFMANCRASLANWMLAPVDYPLRTSHLTVASSAAKSQG
jgi:hypothetical protein